MAAALLSLPSALHAQQDPAIARIEGRLADSATFVMEKPPAWNGVLLLWSHGYSPVIAPAEDSFTPDRDWLLAHGYALAGSSYSTPGWAVAEAVPDQVGVLDAFAKQFGAPRRTIAWGTSMGGLVTAKLLERYPDRLDGAVMLCGSVAGVVGMMNEALDGAFAFKTLLAPGSAIALVNVKDDRANGALVSAAVSKALQSPQGRARLALAAVLAGLPGWTDPKQPAPPTEDLDGQVTEISKTFAMGAFLPRSDQERRAGGVFSWNTGVDYRAQLSKSGRSSFVEVLYRRAGLDLNADLLALQQAPRVAADPIAVQYMAENFAPSGRIARPAVTLHTIGDGLTSVTGERAYGGAVKQAHRGNLLFQLYADRAGHCRFDPSEPLIALKVLEQRLGTGRWTGAPEALEAEATALGFNGARFIRFQPDPFLRSWRPPLGSSTQASGHGLLSPKKAEH